MKYIYHFYLSYRDGNQAIKIDGVMSLSFKITGIDQYKKSAEMLKEKFEIPENCQISIETLTHLHTETE